jgi:hypothetical protein
MLPEINNEAAGSDPSGFNNLPPATAHSGLDWFGNNVIGRSTNCKRKMKVFAETLERIMHVVGMEPANCLVQGRAKERERGTLQFIEPGETREFHIEIGVLSGKAEIEEFESQVPSRK